jgi:hypothetical protein
VTHNPKKVTRDEIIFLNLQDSTDVKNISLNDSGTSESDIENNELSKVVFLSLFYNFHELTRSFISFIRTEKKLTKLSFVVLLTQGCWTNLKVKLNQLSFHIVQLMN